MSKLKIITNGIVKENPIFFQLIGMCPTLAVTTSLENGVGMGMATTAVLIMSNIVISALRSIIPKEVRIPAFVVVIASFVTIVSMVMEAFVPALFASLGIFIPLIVVNCLILARAEAYAFKNNMLNSALDGIGMGIGFTVALALLGAIREVLGGGTLLGHALFGASFKPALIMILPPGGFITLGLVIGLFTYISRQRTA